MMVVEKMESRVMAEREARLYTIADGKRRGVVDA
jgi:hypothetical protein